MIPNAIKPAQNYPWFATSRNILLLVFGFFLLFAAISLCLSYKFLDKVTSRVLMDDRESAGLYARILEEHLRHIVKTMESYTNRPSLIQAVRQKDVAKARKHLVHLIRNNPGIDSMIITDRKGTLWISQPFRPDVQGKNFAYRDWYRGVSGQWEPYISDAVSRVTAEKDTAIHIAVPIFDEQGAVISILQNTRRAVHLSKIFGRVRPAGEPAITITDRKGRMIYSSRYAYAQKPAPYPFYNAVSGPAAAPHQSITVSETSSGGAKRYLSAASLSDIGWKIVVERDRRSILSEAFTYFIQMAVIFILLFLTITLLLMYFRKRVKVQIMRDSLQAEKELQLSETRFRELFDHMSSGVAIYQAVHDGEDFIITDMNAAAQKITRVREGFAGKSVCDIFPGVREFGLFQIFQQVWRTGRAVSHPTSLYQDKHLAFWAENYVYKLPSGQVVAVFDDITERMLAENALRESEQKYRLLFDEMINGYALHEIICDRTGKIVDYRFLSVNRAFEKITGLKASAIIGKTVLEIMPAIEQSWIDRYGKVAVTREPIQFEEYSRQINKYFEVHAFSPEPGKFASVFSDVTERRKAEEEIKRLNTELEQRVLERTTELSAKTAELERLNRVFVDRELKMRELKEKITSIERQRDGNLL